MDQPTVKPGLHPMRALARIWNGEWSTVTPAWQRFASGILLIMAVITPVILASTLHILEGE
jgi:hypothetical protein